MSTETYEYHPAANMFPLLGKKQLADLKADIKAHGLREPLWLCEGKILDGRNRYIACAELGVSAETRVYDGDEPTAFAWSLNGARRHLSISQVATIALEMLPLLKEEAKNRQKRTSENRGLLVPVDLREQERQGKGEATEAAARITGASSSTITRAARIQKERPELIQKIKDGDMSVEAAYRALAGVVSTRDPELRSHHRVNVAKRIDHLVSSVEPQFAPLFEVLETETDFDPALIRRLEKVRANFSRIIKHVRGE